MEQLQFDPRTKAMVKDSLYEFLYGPVQRSYQTRLDSLIIRNTIAGGHPTKSFHYRGNQYQCEGGTRPPRGWNKLMPQFKDEMDALLAEFSDINNRELPFVIGYIGQVLNSSNSFMDYLRLFPDSVHQPIKQIMETCPCCSQQLSDEKVEELINKHQSAITMMKHRMVQNLLY